LRSAGFSKTSAWDVPGRMASWASDIAR
jgi:hypothetical protein